MAIDTTELDTDLTEMIADLPVTMTVATGIAAGQDISVTSDQIFQTNDIGLAGGMHNRNVGVYARVDSFTDSVVAAVNDKVSIAGISYRITAVNVGQDGVGIMFGLQRTDA